MNRALKFLASLGVTLVLSLWAFRGTDWHGQWDSLRSANYLWLIPYLAILLGIHLARTLRWGSLLSGMERVRFRSLNEASGIGFMMLLILPFRLGEFARPFLIAQRSQIRRSAAMTSVVLERITDGLFVATMLRGLLFFVPSTSPGVEWVKFGANLMFAIFGGGLAFLLLATWKRQWAVAVIKLTAGKISPRLADRVGNVVDTFVGAMHQLPSKSQLFLFFLYTGIYWGLNGTGMALVSRAFGQQMGLTLFQGFVVLSVLVVFLMVPAAPGMMGTFQAGVRLGLSLFLPAQVVSSAGLAYANVVWLTQTVQQVVLGLTLMALSHTSFSEVTDNLQEAPSAEPPPGSFQSKPLS